MEKLGNVDKNNKKIWISITGYRILLILKMLLQKGCTINELVDGLKQNKINKKVLSKDTIRIALNTLKKSGCKISRPSKANEYKYELISHPFIFSLSTEELNVFLKLREKIIQELEWQDILILNDVYEKIVSATFNERQIIAEKENRPLIDIDKTILKEISNPLIFGRKVQVIYNSPKFGEEKLDIVPQKITYENGKIYLWCFIYKYSINSLLNIDRIKKINNIDISQTIKTNTIYDVIYTVTGNSVKTFEKKDFEEIIQKTKDAITVRAHVENEFCFIQRILLLGSDFKINSPEFFREKLINKLKLIQKGYKQ